MQPVSKICVFTNPVAGKKGTDVFYDKLDELLNELGIEVSYYQTDPQVPAESIVSMELARGVKDFLVVGGDGTVNMLAKHLVGNRANLGIIPAGSGNGLARHLKIPSSLSRIKEFIISHEVKKIDYGILNDHPFFNVSGLGFDAEVAKSFSKQDSRGLMTYMKIVLKTFSKQRSGLAELDIDGEKLRLPYFLITAANSSEYGNNVRISPRADISDGLLDLCIISPFPALRAIDIGARLITGKISSSKFYSVRNFRELTIHREEKGMVHIDGDPVLMPEKLEIRAVPGGLSVWVPVE